MERGTIYPSWRYHRTADPVLCNDAAHDAELGDEWADTPAAFEPAEAEKTGEKQEIPDIPLKPIKPGRKFKA